MTGRLLKRKRKGSMRRFIAVILALCLLCSTGCAYRQSRSKVVVIPADRRIRALDNGNFEVTPAWLKERYEYEAWITHKLRECEEKK